MGIASYTAAPSSQFGGNARCISLPSILDLIAAASVGVAARIVNAVSSGALATTRAAALALGLFFTPPACNAIATIANTVTSLVPANIGNLSFISPAQAQPAALMKSQSDALNTYNNAVNDFRSILSQRRAQINSNQQLPNLPGDADNEPLLDEYTNLFNIMQAPPVNAQNSDTPFNDVVDLGTDIGRAKGLDAANAEVAGRISLGLFFAETNGNQNMGNARSNTYKGSLQTGVSEDQNGQKKWAAIKKSITAFDPALSARDDKEEARVGNLDHRLNHWTAVRDALMNAHADYSQSDQVRSQFRQLCQP